VRVSKYIHDSFVWRKTETQGVEYDLALMIFDLGFCLHSTYMLEFYLGAADDPMGYRDCL
jgi:hypothetical protein